MTATELTVGNHYFVRQSRRTDEFRGKRYTTPECEKWEFLIVMGKLEEQRGQEVKLTLVGNQFEKDGQSFVFSIGQLLADTSGEIRTLEAHGKPAAQLGRWAEGN